MESLIIEKYVSFLPIKPKQAPNYPMLLLSVPILPFSLEKAAFKLH